MRTKFLTPALSLLLCVLRSTQLNAQGYVEKLPDEVKRPFQEKLMRISSEIRGSDSDEWEGLYTRYVGETWSESLFWTSNDGFAAYRDTCSNGPRAWVNFGSAKFVNGVLVLDSEQNYTGEHSLSLKREYTPVKWGHQRWLIPTDELELFAHAVNSSSWEDYESFYLRVDGNNDEPKGQPEIPNRFRHILDRKPIKAKVVAVGESSENRFGDVTIDVGKNKGVIVGMSFWLTGVKNTGVKISVIRVNEKTAVAKIVSVGLSYDFDDDGNQMDADPPDFIPTPGMSFTNRVSN